MTTELVKRDETEVGIRMQDLSPEYAEIMVLGKVLQLSGYFKDVRDQAQAVTKILFGRELGLSPIVSMGGIHIIEGKPALSSNLMAALIKRGGKYNYRVKVWTNTECVITFKEKDGAAWEDVGGSSFTIEDAVTAKIQFKTANGHATTWAKYPKAMLFARALSQGLRAYCPDVSACPLYVPEELGATVNEDGDVIELPKSARVVPVTTEEIPIAKPKSAARNQPPIDHQEGPGSLAAADHKSYDGPDKCAECGGSGCEKYKDGTRACYYCDGTGKVPPDPDHAKAVEKFGPEVVDMVHRTTRENMGMPPKLPPVEALAAQATASMTPKEGTVPDGCIPVEQAANFHRAFRDNLRKDLKKQAPDLAHAWLKAQGIVDSLGEPTAKAIRKANFYDVREAAETHARSL